MKKTLLAMVLGLGLFAAQPSHAVVIGAAGDAFTVDWFLAAGDSDNDGGVTSSIDLSATADFLVAEFTATYFKLNITIENKTVLSGLVTEAGITSFGFGVDPNATSVSFSDADDGNFTDAEVASDPNQTYPGGFEQIDVCVFTQGCSGSGIPTALAVGQSDSFMLTIYGNFGGNVTLKPFVIKFQTTEGSLEFARVPEPGSLVLMGVGLVFLGFAARRRRVPGQAA